MKDKRRKDKNKSGKKEKEDKIKWKREKNKGEIKYIKNYENEKDRKKEDEKRGQEMMLEAKSEQIREKKN